MAYTARELITRSWFLSGIVSRNLQVPTGDQISDGLVLLNALLDFKQVETDLIPYWQYIELPMVAGQENYFLPFVAEIESATFNLDVVRYPMDFVTRRNYYGSARVDNIAALPFSYNYDRALGGGNFSTYFLPESAFPLKLMAKIFLVDVDLDTDLTNISETVPYTFVHSSNQGYDTSYIEYLRYALAQYMCSEYGILFNPQSEKKLIQMQRMLMYLSPPDLSMIKVTVLAKDSNTGYNWGDVNIGHGWRPD
jgi:hypothetical protein